MFIVGVFIFRSNPVFTAYPNPTRRWRTVRVFISSTFLDFHGERDLLIRHALPELRSRARSLRLDLQVVDLRWGITAQDAESAR